MEMKKENSRFVLSTTDKGRIAAHARAMAKKATYNGYVEAWFNSVSGEITYCELTDYNSYIEAGKDMELIYSAECREEQ